MVERNMCNAVMRGIAKERAGTNHHCIGAKLLCHIEKRALKS
jgi:hypothetical protein